ncbi:TIGR03749 family integrating conjugative element protein [Serratia ureilytica]
MSGCCLPIKCPRRLPPALNGKAAGAAVAARFTGKLMAFPPTRLQLQDVENGRLFSDDAASDKGSAAEPVRIVYAVTCRRSAAVMIPVIVSWEPSWQRPGRKTAIPGA